MYRVRGRAADIRSFFAILEHRGALLELPELIFENRALILEDRLHILADHNFIRTFQVLLELRAYKLELLRWRIYSLLAYILKYAVYSF